MYKQSEGDDQELTLRDYLVQEKLDIEQLNFTENLEEQFTPAEMSDEEGEQISSEKIKGSMTHKYRLELWRRSKDVRHDWDTFSIEIKKNEVINRSPNLHSLFALNIGKATNKIENSTRLTNDVKHSILQIG